MLFKVTSWGLFAVWWAWVVSACKSIESDYAVLSFDERVALLNGDTTASKPAPHAAILFIGRHATYVLPAGIIGVAWLYALVVKMNPHQLRENRGKVKQVDWRSVGANIEYGLKFSMHCLICWFLAYVLLSVLFVAVGLDQASPVLVFISFAAAVGITILERSCVMSKA